jgi:hypothetical protein
MSSNSILLWCSECPPFYGTIEQSFVQQPIVELFLGHLILDEREKFVNANNTKGKNDKSRILMYQLLYILIKCLMFCKHVSI